ncbi:hypothetical protein, partial [Pseudomonas fluorescens]|uniref:hypothetical protein n=1 Tax=Pseudomonas fluorescens TaxID=294 RepID=UPI001C4D3E6D
VGENVFGTHIGAAGQQHTGKRNQLPDDLLGGTATSRPCPGVAGTGRYRRMTRSFSGLRVKICALDQGFF